MTPREPVVALLLSLCFPGAGYAYAGHPDRFAKTAILVGGAYALTCATSLPVFVPVLLHVFTSVAAVGAVRRRNADLARTPAFDAPPPPPPASRRDARSPQPAGRDRDPETSPAPPPPLPPTSFAPSPTEPPPLPPAAHASAPSVVSGERLDAPAFLAELRAAWMDHRERGDPAAFARTKASLILRLRFDDEDDRRAVTEAAAALVEGGVLTPSERQRIEMKGTGR